PTGKVAHTPQEARAIAAELFAAGSSKVVVKAQVKTGGRGKAGGVKLADSADEAETLAGQILGMDIKGHTVHKVLVEEGSAIAQEFYFSFLLDRRSEDTRLNSSHVKISYAVFCLKKKKIMHLPNI